VQRFKQVHSYYPLHESYHVPGVLEAARRHFTSYQFHREPMPHKGKSHNKHRGRAKRHYDSPDSFIERVHGSTCSHKKKRRPHSEYETLARTRTRTLTRTQARIQTRAVRRARTLAPRGTRPSTFTSNKIALIQVTRQGQGG
jgi:hypothetical protein